MGPARLVGLLGEDTPATIWRRVTAGEIRRPTRADPSSSPGRGLSWADSAQRRDVGGSWQRMLAGSISVAYIGGQRFPEVLADDPEPPGVIFWLGDLPAVLGQPRVAIIGTRYCTGYGRAVAAELGRDLAGCGVCVVSGLALGIDGAAHEGALRAAPGAGPLGVAASGVDLPYPSRHAGLWRQVAAAGAVLSETPPGQAAQAWRFPARNRLIAAVAQAVVVVESRPAGGSMLTVAAAAHRGVEVLAVPGPVTSASSEGTNQLLHEGVTPARHAGDVLAVLGDLRPWPARPARDPGPVPPPAAAKPSTGQERGPAPSPKAVGRADPAVRLDLGAPPEQQARLDPAVRLDLGASEQQARLDPAVRLDLGASEQQARLDPAGRLVLGAVDRTPTPTNLVAARTGLPLGMLSVVLLDLESRRLIRGQGIWWERCDRP